MPGGQIIRFIRDAGGARVAYAIVGEGPLILCPAWWVSHLERDWEDPGFRHFFSRLAEGFRIVRYDRPGTGLSDRDVPPRTQAAEVALLARLADALGDPQLSLFAISCAGPVALTYAAAHQDRIRRLCLYGSYANGADIATPELWVALADLVEAHWGVGSGRPHCEIAARCIARALRDLLAQSARLGERTEGCGAAATEPRTDRVGRAPQSRHRNTDHSSPRGSSDTARSRATAGRRIAARALHGRGWKGAPAVDRWRFHRRDREIVPGRARGASVRSVADGYARLSTRRGQSRADPGAAARADHPPGVRHDAGADTGQWTRPDP
jgi:pimeloyl-ACP methyl ester carboxylesterase